MTLIDCQTSDIQRSDIQTSQAAPQAVGPNTAELRAAERQAAQPRTAVSHRDIVRALTSPMPPPAPMQTSIVEDFGAELRRWLLSPN